MTERAPSSGEAPPACPFVAFLDDRDRRSEVPDPRNRCYAEPVPQPRSLDHQATYCVSTGFPSCPVFLTWAARAAAAPDAPGTPDGLAAGDAVPGSGDGGSVGPLAAGAAAAAFSDDPAAPAALRGITGLYEQRPAGGRRPARGQDHGDWVPTTAWAEVPRSEPRMDDAEPEPEPQAAVIDPEPPAVPGPSIARPGRPTPPPPPDEHPPRPPEPTGPVPAARVAAIPVRRRRAPEPSLRPIGSGEWETSTPLGRAPLLEPRRIGPVPLRLAVAAAAVVLVAVTLFGLSMILGGVGGGAPSDSPTPAPSLSAPPGSPMPTPEPTGSPLPSASVAASDVPVATPRTYRVRRGDTLSGIADELNVRVELLICVNDIRDPDVLSPGQRLIVPRRNQRCPGEEASPTPVEE